MGLPEITNRMHWPLACHEIVTVSLKQASGKKLRQTSQNKLHRTVEHYVPQLIFIPTLILLIFTEIISFMLQD